MIPKDTENDDCYPDLDDQPGGHRLDLGEVDSPLHPFGKRKELAPMAGQAVVGGGDQRYPMNPCSSNVTGCVSHAAWTVAGGAAIWTATGAGSSSISRATVSTSSVTV